MERVPGKPPCRHGQHHTGPPCIFCPDLCFKAMKPRVASIWKSKMFGKIKQTLIFFLSFHIVHCGVSCTLQENHQKHPLAHPKVSCRDQALQRGRV